jgi:hypothetical protein
MLARMSNNAYSANLNVFLCYLYILSKLRSIFLYRRKEHEYSGNNLITDVPLFVVPLNIRIIIVKCIAVIEIFEVCGLLNHEVWRQLDDSEEHITPIFSSATRLLLFVYVWLTFRH